jgi:glutamine synthetase
MTSITQAPIDWLRAGAAEGVVHTVRVSWSDRLGTWRGKRVPVEAFLVAPERPVGFCDGMIVVDVQCEIVQNTPFSNFTTGYPDLYVQPDLRTLRLARWTEGEAFVLGDPCDHDGRPLRVAPRVVLARIVDRMAQQQLHANARVVVDGRLMLAPGEPFALDEAGLGAHERPPGILRRAAEGLSTAAIPVEWIARGCDPGAFRLALAAQSPLACTDSTVVAKGALKEVAQACGANATFMTLVPGALAPSMFAFGIEIDGPLGPLDPVALTASLADVRALLQPSVTAFKAGPTEAPSVRSTDGVTTITGISAAAEADPVTALASILAAVMNAADYRAARPVSLVRDLGAAAARLATSEWPVDWLGGDLIENAVPLLEREAELFAGVVTDWEVERYWRLG